MGILFENEREKQRVQMLGIALEEKGLLKPEAKELGIKFKQEIELGTLPKLSIRFIHENIGHGGFAEKALKKGQFAGEYTGLVRENIRDYFAPLNDYLMEYPVNDQHGRSFVIDATHGNECRYYNHSPKPNLKIHYAFVDGFYHAIFLAIRPIKKGEQLTYDYGENYWLLRDRPI